MRTAVFVTGCIAAGIIFSAASAQTAEKGCFRISPAGIPVKQLQAGREAID